MELLRNLFMGSAAYWGGGVSHSIFILSLVITLGLLLGRIKVKNVSLGLTWVLIIGIVFGYFNLNLNMELLHFMREFGLVLFVYCIGMQVGPGFFSSFKKGGLSLNMLIVVTILISFVLVIGLHYATGTSMTALAGILSGAVTNTPSLGAAQQAYFGLKGVEAPEIATGYALAYPMGVIGVILSFILLRYILRIKPTREENEAERGLGQLEQLTVRSFTLEVSNQRIDGQTVAQVKNIIHRHFVISRIIMEGQQEHNAVVNGQTQLHQHDRLLVVAAPADIDAITALIGKQIDFDWAPYGKELISRRILVTRPELNGKTLQQLNLNTNFGATVTRVNRNGVDLVAHPHLRLQLGDRLTVVASELSQSKIEKMLGNSLKRLNYPNLIPIFLGIALGCILANVPIVIPGIPTPIRLGLAGGPFIVAILMGYFGPRYHLITYNTISANMMLREIGITMFLACVGLGAGSDFFHTLINEQGLAWIGYGMILTMLPILLGGIIGRYFFHINYYTLMGVLAGGNTNPPALAFSNSLTTSDLPSAGYATVYPFAMFLRIIGIQILIMVFMS
ncbi:MAG: putative transporter [Prevotella sp.]|nr:putative transporter [Prevotella sp.]